MKWINKGHEFDDAYLNIKNKDRFYLFGAGHDGAFVYDIIKKKYNNINLAGFIDNDLEKQGDMYCGLRVYSLNEIDFVQENAGLIISIAASVTNDLEMQLSSYGLEKGKDFFHYYVFLSVFSAYEMDRLFIPTVSFLPSTKCNLRCEACLNFTPYIKKLTERSWADVKEDIDLFFKHVDYVGLFHISGGEPLLYSNISDLIEYISSTYGEKIHSLETVTNGTVIPSQKFLEAYRNSDITITLDDYREALPKYCETFDEVVSLLEQNRGRGKYIIKKYDEWIDLLPKKEDCSILTNNNELIDKYNSCHIPWQEYKNGKLYTCNYAAYAAVAGIVSEPDKGEYYDLELHSKEQDKELVEFRLGYSENGYAEFCKRCAGFLEVNRNIVKPAVQME